MLPYRLELFGRMRLHIGGHVITRFRTAPTAGLLAFLALRPGKPHGRERLISLFWPDAPLDNARNSLSVSLSHLRGLLVPAQEEAAVLIADRQSVTLSPGTITTDVAEFEAHLEAAARCVPGEERDRRRDAALALYAGDLLEGLYFDWVIAEQTRLAALRERAINGRGEARPPPAPVVVPLPVATVLPLPPRLTRFVDRAAEMAAIRETLFDARLVTITGPGGTGKTRLAEEVARREWEADPRRRIAIVPFAAVAEPRRFWETIAESIAAPVGGADAGEVVRASLAAVPTLLLLDNLEHLLPAIAAQLARLLTAAPRLHCLATSRMSLGIEGESVFTLDPLPLPAPGATLAEAAASPAIRLFTDRAREARADFRLTERNLSDVTALCRDLDGLPLALELAAARVPTQTPARIREMLAESPERLTARKMGRAARHHSLGATVEWSYSLLAPDRRTFLRALAVFCGGWVVGAAAVFDPQAEDVLAELTAASLVRADVTDTGTRFTLLETIRAFSRSLLSPEERRDAAQRHAAWYLAEAEAMCRRLYRTDHVAAARWFETERDNLLAALETLRPDAEKYLRMATAMDIHWRTVAPATGFEILSNALRPLPEVRDSVRAAALVAVSHCCGVQNKGEEGNAAQAEAIRIYREAGDTAGFARARCLLGSPNELAEGIAAAHTAGERLAKGYGLGARAVALWPAGGVAEADRCFAESAAALREAGSAYYGCGALTEWGYSLHWRGEARQARDHLREALQLAQSAAADPSHTLWILAGVEIALGDYANAEQHARRSYELRSSLGINRHLWGAGVPSWFRAHLYGGDLSGARETLALYTDLLRSVHGSVERNRLGALPAELAWAEGNDREALACAQAAFTTTDAAANHPPLSTCSFWAGILVANARATLADAELRVGLLDATRETLAETLRFRVRCNILGRAVCDIEGIAVALAVDDAPESAARLFAAADTLRLRAGTPAAPFHDAFLQPLAAAARARYSAAWRDGARLSLPDAIALALSTADR